MTDKEFRRLKRADLIDIIIRLQENEDKLKAENAELEQKLRSGSSGDENGLPEDTAGSVSAQAERSAPQSIPDRSLAVNEKHRLRYRRRLRQVMASTVGVLVVVAAAAVLVSTLFFTVLQVSGGSMEPTLTDQDVIVVMKNSSFSTGDLIGIRYEGRVLLKRVIGGPGDYIDIDDDGNVSVNGELLDEPYVSDKSLGECDLTFPYQVPEDVCYKG